MGWLEYVKGFNGGRERVALEGINLEFAKRSFWIRLQNRISVEYWCRSAGTMSWGGGQEVMRLTR